MNQSQKFRLLITITVIFFTTQGMLSNAFADDKSISTKNAAMRMDISSAGRITAVEISGQNELCSRGAAMSGFSLRDFSRKQDSFKPINCDVSSHGDTVRFHGLEDGLELTAQMRAVENGWHIHGSLWRADNTERFVSLRFAIPLDVAGWMWWDHIAKKRPLVPINDCATPQPQKPHGASEKNWKTDGLGSGPNGRQDLFPVTAVSNNRSTVAYAVPMDKQFFRYVMYDAKDGVFALTYDFAMVNGQVNYSHEVPFDFYILTPAGKWGLRAAVEEYFKKFPQWAGQR